MKRWHEEIGRTRREWREHRRIHVEMNKSGIIGLALYGRPPGSDPNVIDCACDEQVGRFRKRNAYGCGRPQCFICHSDKFPKRRRTLQERIAELRFKEQLHDS